MVFVHGFSRIKICGVMVAPGFQERFRTVLLPDLVGNGKLTRPLTTGKKYGSLQGHADDVPEVIEEFAIGPVIFYRPFCGQ
jgi:sigma-B regulation protein RsbQ